MTHANKLREVIDKFIKHAEKNDIDSREVQKLLKHVEIYCDDLANEDYFGTEQQCHPFGDKRD